MEKVTKLIVETFEKESPALCLAIKQAVDAGENRGNFIAFVKKTFGDRYATSVSSQLAITVFDYYSKAKGTV